MTDGTDHSPIGAHERVATEYNETGLPVTEHTCLDCGETASNVYGFSEDCSVDTGSDRR